MTGATAAHSAGLRCVAGIACCTVADCLVATSACTAVVGVLREEQEDCEASLKNDRSAHLKGRRLLSSFYLSSPQKESTALSKPAASWI